ncbi:MAG: peptidylprolyl isomerase [Phycisphaerae bacterium]|nr:peptidylprolyl isomerase [Phycisphaerae bacterium]
MRGRSASVAIGDIAGSVLKCAVVVAMLLRPGNAHAQVCVDRLYHAPEGGIPIRVASPVSEPLISLFVAGQSEPIAQARTRAGTSDLLALFPDLHSLANGSVLMAQLESDGVRCGSPLVVEPLTPVARATDAWSARVLRSMDSNDRGSIESLLRMPPRARESLRLSVEVEATSDRVSHAWRVYESSLVVLTTSEGSVTLGLRPDAAPRAVFHFRALVEGGFYDGPGLSCVRDSETRQPAFFQGGDPVGDGSGGAGTVVPFEQSGLNVRPGVVAMARVAGEPQSASSQFVIVLSARAAAAVAESATPFAVVLDGGATLAALSRQSPSRSRVIRACLVPAPPYEGVFEPTFEPISESSATVPGR